MIKRSTYHQRNCWAVVIPLDLFAWVKSLFILLAVAYAAVTIIHLANGISIDRALVGGFLDGRVAVSCPQKPRLLWDVVNRGELVDFSLHLGVKLGGSYAELCEVDSFDEIFN